MDTINATNKWIIECRDHRGEWQQDLVGDNTPTTQTQAESDMEALRRVGGFEDAVMRVVPVDDVELR